MDFALSLDTGSSGGSSSGGSSSGASSAEKNEIVDKHNALRSNVQPPASNMLKMVAHSHKPLHTTNNIQTTHWGINKGFY